MGIGVLDGSLETDQLPQRRVEVDHPLVELADETQRVAMVDGGPETGRAGHLRQPPENPVDEKAARHHILNQSGVDPSSQQILQVPEEKLLRRCAGAEVWVEVNRASRVSGEGD